MALKRVSRKGDYIWSTEDGKTFESIGFKESDLLLKDLETKEEVIAKYGILVEGAFLRFCRKTDCSGCTEEKRACRKHKDHEENTGYYIEK